MRTTVDIPDGKYRRLKSTAAQEGTTVKSLVLEAVDIVLTKHSEGKQTTNRRVFPLVKSKRKEKISLTNEQIYDIIGFP
jgi:hypothetical protein